MDRKRMVAKKEEVNKKAIEERGGRKQEKGVK